MHHPIVELEQQIASLQTLVSQLQATHSVSNIDKDLLRQKCVELYELILILPAENIPTPAIPSSIATTTASKPEVIPELMPDIVLLNDVPKIEESTLETQDLFAGVSKTETEIKNEAIEQILEEEKNNSVDEITLPLMKEEAQEISLHEKIAFVMPPKPDLSEKLSESHITSLKNAINVNLKIAIVNDLFKENTVEYVKAIDKLNNSENIHEAMRYFTELKHTYDWDNQNALVKEFESLLNKRFQ